MSNRVIFMWKFPPRGPTAVAGLLKKFPAIVKAKNRVLKVKEGRENWFVRVRSYKLGWVPYASSGARLRSPSSPTRFLTNLNKIFPQLLVVIAESHVNASGLNFGISVVSIRRSGDRHVRKIVYRRGVCKALSFQKLKKHVWGR